MEKNYLHDVIQYGEIKLDDAAIVDRIKKVCQLHDIKTKPVCKISHGIINGHDASNISAAARPEHWPECQPLVKLIRELLNETYPGENVPITKGWFIIMPKGGRAYPHQHRHAKKAVFNYYVKCEEDHSTVDYWFEDRGWIEQKQQTGRWTFFDKSIWHRMMDHNSDELRISLAFDL